jgi:TM2 domain-containing membrane protein YozV
MLDIDAPPSENFSMTNGTASGQGTAGNVIASLASFFIPGLGQLIQGRLLPAILFFLFTGILWFFLLGWLIHLWACLDAALWKPRS